MAYSNCGICKEIEGIKNKKNTLFITELPTGYVVLGDWQYYKGYTLFLCKKHVFELHELPKIFRQDFLKDMSIVAEAVYKAFKPQKLNYEMLGNSTPHLHWHFFPRYKNDPIPQRPIWCIDSSITCSEKMKPSLQQIKRLKLSILSQLKKLR